MKICVAGWYFNDHLLKTLDESGFDAFLVAHRPFKGEFPHAVIPNVGLEFGCYDWYVKNKWKDGPVLFIHDDNEITPQALKLVAAIRDIDQCYLFTNQQEAEANGFCHGRAMFCSERFLKRILEDGGFWYDEGNHGDVAPTTADSPNYHNAGIQMFRAYLNSVGRELKVSRLAVLPGLKNGYRGRV